MTFTQAKRLVLQTMRQQGIKIQHIQPKEINRVAAQVMLEVAKDND